MWRVGVLAHPLFSQATIVVWANPSPKGTRTYKVQVVLRRPICTIGNLEAEVSSHVPCPTLTKVQERVRVIPHGGIMGGPVKVDSLMSNSTESQSPNMPV